MTICHSSYFLLEIFNFYKKNTAVVKEFFLYLFVEG